MSPLSANFTIIALAYRGAPR